MICVPELPTGMEQGDDIRVPITFSGFFLKLWAYESEFMVGRSSENCQTTFTTKPTVCRTHRHARRYATAAGVSVESLHCVLIRQPSGHHLVLSVAIKHPRPESRKTSLRKTRTSREFRLSGWSERREARGERREARGERREA